MRLSVSISTAKELEYPAESGAAPVLLNKKDEKNQVQNFSVVFTGFDYTGSLQPLFDIVSAWIKENNK